MILSRVHKESSRSRRGKGVLPVRDTLPSLSKSEWRRVRPRHRLLPIGSDGRPLVSPVNGQTNALETRDLRAAFRLASFGGHSMSVLKSTRGIGPIRMTSVERGTERWPAAQEQ